MTNLIIQIKHSVHFWWMFILSGTCLIIFSVYVATNPNVTYDVLSLFFGTVLVINGILEIIFCITNHKWFTGWGWYLAGAIFDLILAALFVVNPILAAISLPWFAGIWLLIRSIVMIGRSFQVKKKGLTEWPWLLLWALSGFFFSLINIYNPLFGESRLVIWTAISLFAVGLFYVHFGFLIRSSDRWINKMIHT